MKHTLTILSLFFSISILLHPQSVFAKEISDVTWKDVSPVSSDRSDYIDNDQRLYSLGKNIYLARYENNRNFNKKLTVSFATLNKDNSWRYLLQHYYSRGIDTEPIIYNHGLYFGFGYSIFRVNHNNSINPMISCNSNLKIGAYGYKKKLYITCNRQFQSLIRGVGRLSLLRNNEDQDSPVQFPFYDRSGTKYRGKYYFFGIDQSPSRELKSYVLNTNRGPLTQNLHVPNAGDNISYMSTQVFKGKLYLFADYTAFGSMNGIDWGSGHTFPRKIKASYKTDTHMYALGYSSRRDHSINVYYFSQKDGWNRSLAQGHNFTDIVATKGSYLYIASKEADDEYVILRTNDGLIWSPVGDKTFTSVADIEFASNYLYVVTDESQVYKSNIK